MERIYIEKPQNLDPITIYLDEGRITVTCFADAWTHYFGSYSGPLIEFLKGCYPDYLAAKFEQSSYKSKMPSRADKEYIFRISSAVLTHLKTLPNSQETEQIESAPVSSTEP